MGNLVEEKWTTITLLTCLLVESESNISILGLQPTILIVPFLHQNYVWAAKIRADNTPATERKTAMPEQMWPDQHADPWCLAHGTALYLFIAACNAISLYFVPLVIWLNPCNLIRPNLLQRDNR